MNNRDVFNNVMLGNDYMKDLMIEHEWLNRAVQNPDRTSKNQSVYTSTVNVNEQEMVIPLVRLIDGKLKELTEDEAINIALKKNDFISVPSIEAGTYLSYAISNWLGRLDVKKGEK